MLVVTGASGFIGCHVVAGAATSEWCDDVVTVDRAGRPDLRVELADPGRELALVLQDADAVIHLAGAGGVRAVDRDADRRRWRDNVLAARTVLRLTPPAVPVIVASSSSVYGGARHGRPSHEDDRLRPVGGYAASKAVVERECHQRAGCGGRVTIVRPFTVVGDRQRADMAFARWVDAAAAGRPLTVLGSPDRTRDLTDVGDVAAALLRVAARPPGTTVNVGSGTPVSLAQMTAAVARHLGDTGVDVAPPSPAEPDHTLADTARCQQLVGFVPRSPDLDGAVAALAAGLFVSA